MRKLFSFCLALVTSASLAFGAVPEDQLTFISHQDGSSVGLAQVASHQTLEYSLDGSTWKSMTTETTFSLNKDIVLYVRGKLTDNNSRTDYTQFAITGSVEAKGNINYIWDYENLDAPLKECCGFKLFYGCVGLTSAPKLPATILAEDCYHGMFNGCASLTTSPMNLPALILSKSCYQSMFKNCTNLVTPPELPATTLADSCYLSIFYGCIKLNTAPTLPATILKEYCYYLMFYNCSSLTTAPELPALTLAKNCYHGMFNGCSLLTNIPDLPATSLADECYKSMFYNCTSLTTAPEVLPANILTKGCYESMFKGCSNLKKAPKLPATILADFCYCGMFYECTNLTTAPALPATTLQKHCYRSMFYGCALLETAPTLPARNLVDSCYRFMFYECTKLNYIRCFATNIPNIQCTANWMQRVAATGTFVKHSNMNDWSSSVAGIPSGWNTMSLTPNVIHFDANGGTIPEGGKMGSTPSKDASWLNSDKNIGWVMVYSTSISFSQMRNDCPTREGHTFLGWYTAKSGGVQVYDNVGIYKSGTYWTSDGKWKGTADLQLYAQWSVNSYTITWLQDDGSLIDKTTVQYGLIPTHVAPTKEPTAEYTYTFAGWAPEVVAVTDNATYIATYTAQQIPTGLNETKTDVRATKIIREGQVLIQKGEKTYTVTGQEVR